MCLDFVASAILSIVSIMSLTGTAAALLIILFATKRVEMPRSAATDCSILDAGSVF